MSEDLHQEVYKYLQTQRLMSVATYGETPWIANVYYVVDEDLNLYFISKTAREHCQAIEQNPKVACAIADSSQPIHLPQKGIQLHGEAGAVGLMDKIKWTAKMWNSLIANEGGEKIDSEKFVEAAVSKVYRITPKRIKFFNTELWPKEKIKILEL